MSPQIIAVLVSAAVAVHLSILGFLVRGQMAIGKDTREIKTVLGINGHKDTGLVARVKELGERSHQHANDLTVLMTERDLHMRENT